MSTYMSTNLSPHLGSSMNSSAVAAASAKPAARAVKRKTRITIYLDDEVLHEFRAQAEQSGKGYQTLINAALRTGLAPARQALALAE